MWRLSMLVLALALGGCNMVVSDTPWFTTADEAGGPRLREGLWAGPPDAGCTFKESDPADQWPKCANGILLKDHRMTPLGKQGASATMNIGAYVLAAGPPPIWQMRLTPSDALPMGGDLPQYIYLGFAPTKTDPDGRVTGFSSWLVQCGPLSGTGDKAETVTHAPFPGLVVGKVNCTAKARADLLNAARLSKDLPSQDNGETRWVRDGTE